MEISTRPEELTPEVLRFVALQSYRDYVNMVWFATKEPNGFARLELYEDITGDPAEPDRMYELGRILRTELIGDLRAVVESTRLIEGIPKFPASRTTEYKELYLAVNDLLSSIDVREFVDYDGLPMWKAYEGLPNPLRYQHNLLRVARPSRSHPIPLLELLDNRQPHPKIKPKLAKR